MLNRSHLPCLIWKAVPLFSPSFSSSCMLKCSNKEAIATQAFINKVQLVILLLILCLLLFLLFVRDLWFELVLFCSTYM